MIAQLTAFLKAQETIQAIIGTNVFYKKPIQEKQPENYLYYTTTDYKDSIGFKTDVTFHIVCESFTKIELLTEALRVVMRDRDKKIPDALKVAIPKLWKINEVLKFDFDEDLIRVIKYELNINN